MSDLAVLLDADLPAASRTASRLVSAGLVDRQEDPDDRRARLLTLTAAGHALIERTSRERVQTAIATARSMPGVVVDAVAPAMQQLIGLGKKPERHPREISPPSTRTTRPTETAVRRLVARPQ